MIHTARAENKDPRREVNKFVMSYNSARHSATGKAPVDLLMNRSVRTLLPGLPQPLDEDRDRQVRETDRAKKEYNKEYRKSDVLKELKFCQTVYERNNQLTKAQK